MKKFNFLQNVLIILLQCSNIVYSRVVYILAHGEKPSIGELDTAVQGGTEFSSNIGLGNPNDGLGYTGTLRAACMMDVFGPNAPEYRRPKRILVQQFVLQNNGDFIHCGMRGHHTSRRMYHQTYALALALGIDPDQEKCCGGNDKDLMEYIHMLPPEDDPILIVDQHSVCDTIAKVFALSNGQSIAGLDFGREYDKIWTMIDGKLVEEWRMCCPAIKQCTASTVVPNWVSSVTLPPSNKAPIIREPSYPSYIYTPENVREGTWSYRSNLRKRGLWSGEECINSDLVDCTYLKNQTKTDEEAKLVAKRVKRETETENIENSSFHSQIINITLIFSLILIINLLIVN